MTSMVQGAGLCLDAKAKPFHKPFCGPYIKGIGTPLKTPHITKRLEACSFIDCGIEGFGIIQYICDRFTKFVIRHGFPMNYLVSRFFSFIELFYYYILEMAPKDICVKSFEPVSGQMLNIYYPFCKLCVSSMNFYYSTV